MANAELSEQPFNRADLNPASPARVPQLGRLNMVLTVGNDQWQRSELLNDAASGPRPPEPPKKLLEHEARGEDRFAASIA